MDKDKIQYAEDDNESIRLLLRLRVPSLVIGLCLGMLLSIITSKFAEVLSKHIAVAFFIPFIVYIAAAVGTQTQSIYIRDLRSVGKANFKKYLIKETVLGFILGVVFGLLTAMIVMLWFNSSELMFAISLSVFGAVASAPLIALVVTELLQLQHTDPAASAGPIATVIQDAVSVLIYGLIASAILL